MNRLLWILLLSGLVANISGCCLVSPRVSSPASSDPSIFQTMQVDDIQTEIKRRESMADADNQNHFALVVLYTHFRNQNPDYRAAERHLSAYLSGLSAEDQDWQARYIYYLLKRINAGNEESGQIQGRLEQERAKRIALQTQMESDQKMMRVTRAALQKSKKKSRRLRGKLKRKEKKLAAVSRLYERQKIENEQFKRQLNDLTELYLDLEKKRQKMQ